MKTPSKYEFSQKENLALEVALEKRGAWESWEIERLGFGPMSV